MKMKNHIHEYKYNLIQIKRNIKHIDYLNIQNYLEPLGYTVRQLYETLIREG